ncbi:hypothetical protein [Flavobacterium rhizosphaerae]|uniref:TonB C-terminal domain-containing protein n=1 Tax=Flavobacterium rhizosphaerae TaxID=3163298 RepID=A0ABW8Z1Z7_9FLAO
MRIIPFLLLILFSSCKFSDKQVPDKDELLKQRLEQLDLSKVSDYPSLPECDSISDKKRKKECFFTTMAQLIQQKLDTDTLAILYPEIDTIAVEVTIYPDATLSFSPKFSNDSLKYNTSKIDSLLKSRLVNFPPIEPAQKEGVPVKTQFILPVILDVEQ